MAKKNRPESSGGKEKKERKSPPEQHPPIDEKVEAGREKVRDASANTLQRSEGDADALLERELRYQPFHGGSPIDFLSQLGYAIETYTSLHIPLTAKAEKFRAYAAKIRALPEFSQEPSLKMCAGAIEQLAADPNPKIVASVMYYKGRSGYFDEVFARWGWLM